MCHMKIWTKYFNAQRSPGEISGSRLGDWGLSCHRKLCGNISRGRRLLVTLLLISYAVHRKPSELIKRSVIFYQKASDQKNQRSYPYAVSYSTWTATPPADSEQHCYNFSYYFAQRCEAKLQHIPFRTRGKCFLWGSSTLPDTWLYKSIK